MPEILDPRIKLTDYINSVSAELKAEIAAIKNGNTDQRALTGILLQKYRIEPLKLNDPRPVETLEKKVKRNYYGTPQMVDIVEVKVTIPFSGDKILFNCQPATYTRVVLEHRHQIFSGIVVFYIELDQFNDEQYEAELKKFTGLLSTNLDRVNMQVGFFNDGLKDLINALLTKKMAELNQKLNFMEKIGLKVNPNSDAFLVPSPITRRVVPVPVTDTDKLAPARVLPVLQAEVYEDIREVIYYVGQAIERKPSLYRSKKEEDLRDMFLLFLETRYESTSGVGEAFNKSGKTDILLKYAKDGSNIFVAECKVWKGQKQLFAAIDQLLGYLTYRDSKTALMIFVKQQNFSTALNVVEHFVNRHPRFKRFVNATYNSSFAFEMSLPGDESSTIAMEFMLFHFPEDGS